MIVFLTVINVILTVVIIVMVLLQQGKGSDLGSAFGGGSSNSMFGALGPSDFLGKLKTTFQMIGLGFILITPITTNLIFHLSLVLILISAIISWYSFLSYLKKWIV